MAATPSASKAAVAAAAAPIKATPVPTKESLKDKRLREAREREARAAAAPAAPVPTGVLRIAISPWGEVEVDGRAAGTSPPLNELSLPEGKHQIVIRNTDLPPYSTSVIVTPGQAVSLKYKF